jgi:hypothetical protein
MAKPLLLALAGRRIPLRARQILALCMRDAVIDARFKHRRRHGGAKRAGIAPDAFKSFREPPRANQAS